MKTMFLFVMLLPFVLTACVNVETLDEIQKYPASEEISILRVEDNRIVNRHLYTGGDNFPFLQAFMSLRLRITNQMEGMYLEVDGLRICNLHTCGDFCMGTKIEEGYWMLGEKLDTLSFSFGRISIEAGTGITDPQGTPLALIPQTRKAWFPSTPISTTTGAHLLLKCRIYSISDVEKGYQEGEERLIWGDNEGKAKELAIPFNLSGNAGDTIVCSMEMKSGCAWYCIDGDNAEKVFVPISFTPTVEEWKTHNN